MTKVSTPLLLMLILLSGCPEERATNSAASSFHGVWVKEGDVPGRQPADTLFFFKKNGRDLLAFHFASPGGANWPADVETEYRFEKGKLILKDFSGGAGNFLQVESFRWIEPNRKFSAKLYQLVQYMSADYRVTYRKIN